MTDRALWADVLAVVERAVGAGPVNLWLRDAALIDADREEVVIAVATPFARQHVAARLADALAGAFESLLGARPAHVRIIVDAAAAGHPEPTAASGAVRVPSAPPSSRASGRIARVKPPLNDEMCGESFVVGAGNQVAYRAAEKVWEAPGEDLNPLVITGPDGLGKTHLLTLITRRLSANEGAKNVLFVTAEDYANQYFQGIRSSQTERFRDRYRKADAVVIDDIHLLQTKQKTQIEFLHTFDELILGRKQVVVSCEVSPKRLENLNPGLAGRLLAGLVVELAPPDLDMRRRIVDMLAKRHRITLSREVQEFMARNVTRNIRDLVGAIKRFQAHAAIGERIDVPLAKRRLEDLLGPKTTVPPEELLLRLVADRCGAPIDDIRGGSRRHSVTRARQIAMFLVRRLTKLSLTEIGKFFGREPSTVTYAEDAIAQLLVADDNVNRIVEECQERFEDRR